MSQAGSFAISSLPPGTIVETLTGNSGGAVGPDGSNNINVVGDGTTIDVTGNPGTNTLTISALSSGGATSFPTDSGTATPAAGVLNIIADNAANNAGSSVLFSGSGNTVLLNVTDASNNTIIGQSSGNLTLAGQDNVILGVASGVSIATSSNNIMVGVTVGDFITTGNNNILIGNAAGNNYTIGSESNNILIGTLLVAIAGESNTLRIGTSTGTGNGQLDQAFISGIDGVDVGSVATVVTENGNQLGTAVITAGTGITVTPGSNTITIAVDGLEASSFPTDSGTATPAAGVLNIISNHAALHAGSSVSFSGSGNTVLLNVTDARFNTIIGLDSGNLTILGSDNVILGTVSGTSLTTGSENVLIGDGTGGLLDSGSRNILIGTSTGDFLSVGSETDNIFIGANINGVSGESNTLRISNGSGTGTGQVTRAFIGGIDGVDVGSVATVVTESGDQLGTAIITGGTGITVTTGSNSIVISGSGTIVLSYKNVTTFSSPYVVLISDDYISVDCSAGPVTIQLPNAATLGKTFVIKDRTGSAAINNITVTTVGGVVNIDGASTFIMNSAFQAISIIGNNTSYEVY